MISSYSSRLQLVVIDGGGGSDRFVRVEINGRVIGSVGRLGGVIGWLG